MRRLLTMTVLAATTGPAIAQDGEAERLVRSVQDKVRAAKTVRVRFEVAVTDALGKTGTVNGTLVLGDGQKYRAEGEGTVFGQAVKFTEVSDGDRTAYRDAQDPKRDATEPAAKGAGTYWRGALPRDGFLIGSLNLKERSEWGPDAVKLSDFKLAGEETVGGRKARVVGYAVTVKGGSDPLPVKVWVDAETGLPVKLALTGGKSDIRAVTETYAEFAIDPKVDARTFELPK
jgi:outer membrane lipoprotein-sorting protein